MTLSRFKTLAIRGYTAMEVVMAAGLFAVGATGVLSMQRSAISGNMRAHRIDVATGIASAWIERARAEAALWKSASEVTARPILKDVATGIWTLTARSATLGLNPSFDINGRELPSGVAGADETYFCVMHRATWVVPNRAMRLDVRVYWASGAANAVLPIATVTGACNDFTAGTVDRDYGSIVNSSLVRGNF